MTALLDTDTGPRSTLDVIHALRAQVGDWNDSGQVAQTAAELLRSALARPLVSIFTHEPEFGELVLAGTAPGSESRSPKGSRRTSERRVLDAVLEQGTTQRNLNYYVAPDFVQRTPGETRSALGVPVLAGGRVLGVIHLEYASPHLPSPGDEEVAEAVASQLGAAWALASPHETGRGDGDSDGQVDRKLRKAATLAAISGAIAQAEDFSATFDRIAEAAVQLLGCGGALLLTRHASRQMLQIAGRAGSLELPSDSLIPLTGTLAGQVARNGETIDVTMATAATDPILPVELVAPPPRDGLIVPVTSRGKTTGALLVVDSGESAGYSAEDVQLVQALADQAGAAEAMGSIPQLRQRISDAALIAEVGRAMTGTLGLDEVLALIVRAAEMLVNARCASVALLSDDGTELILAATSGSLQGKEGARLPLRETVVGWVAATGETLITESLENDSRGWPLGDGFGPGALVPLEFNGQIRGVLLGGRAVDAPVPTDQDLDALRKLGAYASIAIENASLYRQQTELSRTLQMQARELEKAYADLGASQQRLLVSEKMAALGRVTAGIAHEINSPLGSILNCLQLATTYAQEYRDSANDPDVTPDDHVGIATDLLESLVLAEEATRRVGQFVRTIKGQTRMDDEVVRPFDPAEEIDGTLLLLRHDLDADRITLEPDLEPGIEVHGDPSKFAVVVQNLVSNAIDAYEEGGGAVRIRLRRDGAAAVLEVTDEGVGIPEEIRQRIYDYLFTTKDVGRGTGLGLSLVHSIVTSHFRGNIDFNTEARAGTTFVVTIPLQAES